MRDGGARDAAKAHAVGTPVGTSGQLAEVLVEDRQLPRARQLELDRRLPQCRSRSEERGPRSAPSELPTGRGAGTRGGRAGLAARWLRGGGAGGRGPSF